MPYAYGCVISKPKMSLKYMKYEICKGTVDAIDDENVDGDSKSKG